MTKEDFKNQMQEVIDRFGDNCPGGIDTILPLKVVDCNPAEMSSHMQYIVDERGLNVINMTHGGTIACIIDNASSLTVAGYIDCEALNTVNLNINYLRGTGLGDILDIYVRITKVGNTICAARTEIYCRNKLCYTADSLHFRLKNNN